MENNTLKILTLIESHPIAIIIGIALFFSLIYFLRIAANIISEVVLLVVSFFQKTWFFYDKRKAIRDFFYRRHIQKIKNQNRRRHNASKTKK